jgi:hypothetical protein
MLIRISILSCLLLVGCTSAPNALHMELAPVQEAFEPNEPILLKARLVANKDPVSMDRGNFIAIEVTHPDWAEPAKSRDWPVGRKQYVGPVLYPISSTGMILDVADSQSRYVIVEPGRPLERTLRLQAYRGGLTVEDVEARSYRDWIPLPGPLREGHYHVRARLVTETNFYFVHPLFWKPYDQPVVGETDFVIRPGAGATRTPTGPTPTPTSTLAPMPPTSSEATP